MTYCLDYGNLALFRRLSGGCQINRGTVLICIFFRRDPRLLSAVNVSMLVSHPSFDRKIVLAEPNEQCR